MTSAPIKVSFRSSGESGRIVKRCELGKVADGIAMRRTAIEAWDKNV